MQRKTTVSIVLSAAIFLFLEIAALAILRRSSTLQNIWLNRAAMSVRAALWGGGETLRNHFSLSAQNDSLISENAALRRSLSEYQQLEAKGVESRNSAPRLDRNFEYLPATVVKMSRNSAHNYIILNKGSEDGVLPQSGIITSEGVVGIVTAVDRHHSYGLTLMNYKLSIGARLASSGVLTPVVWDGRSRDGAIAKDIAPHVAIAQNDTLYTSGLSTIFPADVPVGVSRGSKLVDGSTRQLDVRLFQSFSSLRYVTVTIFKDKLDIAELEKKGEGQL